MEGGWDVPELLKGFIFTIFVMLSLQQAIQKRPLNIFNHIQKNTLLL